MPVRGWIPVLVAALVLTAPIATAAPWSTLIVSGARVLLNYPSLIDAEAARALLADRERALVFAEETLGGRVFRRLIVTLEPTLVSTGGFSEPTDGGGAITLYIPAHALNRFASDGTSPFAFFGCHEEVHAVANHLWLNSGLGTLYGLSEGIATHVEELHRGAELRHSIARALQVSGCLYGVEQLLSLYSPDGPVEVVQLNVYYAGASLVEFLIETYGMERFAELYGVEWVRFDVRNAESGFIEADPAEEVVRVYERTMAQLDDEWQVWVAAHASSSPADADVFLRAVGPDVKRLEAAVLELEEIWRTSAFQLVGPSARVGGLYDRITKAVYALADVHGDALSAAYDAFLQSLDRLDGLLNAWLAAVHAMEEVLPLIDAGEVSERVLDLLEAAESGYKAVEDTYMLDRVRDLLAEYPTAESSVGS